MCGAVRPPSAPKGTIGGIVRLPSAGAPNEKALQRFRRKQLFVMEVGVCGKPK